MPTKEILIAARKLISAENTWTQRTLARDETGEPVAPDQSGAVCFCSIGAIKQACGQGKMIDMLRALNALTVESIKSNGCSSISKFNDNSSHTQVLALFDKAIAKLSTSRIPTAESYVRGE